MPDHLSSCAMHNGPALAPGPCDCGADPGKTIPYSVEVGPFGDAIVMQGGFFLANCGQYAGAKGRADMIAAALNRSMGDLRSEAARRGVLEAHRMTWDAYRDLSDLVAERAYHLARATLKPGDKIRVLCCGNSRGSIFIFAGWDGRWAVSRTGVDDLAPAGILTVNGKWVDWSMTRQMWAHLGPRTPAKIKKGLPF